MSSAANAACSTDCVKASSENIENGEYPVVIPVTRPRNSCKKFGYRRYPSSTNIEPQG